MGATSGALYVKFDGNVGHFTYGKDGDEIERGTKVAINHREFRNGWICWKDGEVVEEIMTNILNGKPPGKGELADHGPYEDEKDGWREQSSIQFRDIESGDEFEYKASSKSGRIAVANLVRDFGKQYQLHPDSLAIVELGATSFEAKDAKGKKLGKKWAPVFKIVGWQSEQDLMDRFAAAAAASEDAEDGGDDDELPVNNAARRTRKF